MKRVKYMSNHPSRRILALILISLIFCLTACDVGVAYRPPFGFVILKISTKGISVNASSPGLETPIGTFTVDVSDLVSDANKQQPLGDGLLLTTRYYKQSNLVDEVYQMNTGGSKVSVTTDGQMTISIENQRVFVDASKGNITTIEVRGSSISSPGIPVTDTPTPVSTPVVIPTSYSTPLP